MKLSFRSVLKRASVSIVLGLLILNVPLTAGAASFSFPANYQAALDYVQILRDKYSSFDTADIASVTTTTTVAITPSTAVSGTVAVPYSQTFTASNFNTKSLSWMIASGKLPPGLKLIPSGTQATISGTPTVAGSYTFALLVTSKIKTAVRVYTIKIASAPLPPPPPPVYSVTLAPATLPNGAVNTLYSQTLTASTNASGPFSWSLSNGSLPAGLSLSASSNLTTTISGTPTTAATSTFTVKVTNGTSSTTKTYTIGIAPAPIPKATVTVVTSVTNNDGGTKTSGDFQITVTGANATPSSFAGSTGGTPVTVDAGQSYSVAVSADNQYNSSLSSNCSGSLSSGASATCTVTLDDKTPPPPPPPPTPTNLIANPDFEIAAAGSSSLPDKWMGGGYGNNTRAFIYPVTDAPASDISGGKAARLTISSYVDGDAKWMFTPVAVTGGREYAFSDSYIATAPTDLVAVYCAPTDPSCNAPVKYDGFISVPSSSSWKSAVASFTVPASGVGYMTVFHRLAGNGSLTVDHYSLSLVPAPTPFTEGFVSLTFDDGFVSQYQNGKPILDNHGLKGTFYMISHASRGFSISNASLATADPSNSSKPKNWNTTGSSATFTYPAVGNATAKAVAVSAASAGTNAGWYFEPITVLADTIYAFSDEYKSTAASSIVAVVTTTSGTQENASVVDINGTDLGTSIALPSTGGAWVTLPTVYFYLPANAKTVTVMHRLTGAGTLTVDNENFGSANVMTKDESAALQAAGHEIGGHTQTHADLSTLSNADATAEISGGRQDLLNGGATPVFSLAYPYGSYNSTVQTISQTAGYSSGRTVVAGFNAKSADKFALKAQSVNADTTVAQVKQWIDQARADKTWLILTFHDIVADTANYPYGSTPSTLQAIADYLTANSIPVKTVAAGVAQMN